ncbi:MAG: hypothetical protein ACKPKO_09640, partial [Candidatus Fonsibacter sp.]
EVISCFQKGWLISVIKTMCQRYFFLCKNDENVELICLQFEETICGSAYYQWKLSDVNSPLSKTKADILQAAQNFCLMLPKIISGSLPREDESYIKIYTLTDMDWNDLLKNGSIGLPQVEQATY